MHTPDDVKAKGDKLKEASETLHPDGSVVNHNAAVSDVVSNTNSRYVVKIKGG